MTLFVDFSPSEEPVFEVLPAITLGADRYKLLGSPGLASGCAAGDVVRCSPDGRFVVEEKGGNYCVQAFGGGPFSEEDLEALGRLASRFSATAEWPQDRRFAVVTIPSSASIPDIESALDAWAQETVNAQWWFSNVD